MLFHVVDVGTHTTMHSCVNIHIFLSFPYEWNNSSPGWCCDWKEEWIQHPAPPNNMSRTGGEPRGAPLRSPRVFWIRGLWLGIWEPVFLPGCSSEGRAAPVCGFTPSSAVGTSPPRNRAGGLVRTLCQQWPIPRPPSMDTSHSAHPPWSSPISQPGNPERLLKGHFSSLPLA